MKTAKFLLALCMMFISFNSLLASNSGNNGTWYFSPEATGSFMETGPGSANGHCTCTCDACKNCNHGDPDRETYYEESHFRVMSSRDFAEFKQFIANRTFESTKLDMSKSVIDNNLFTTEQVSEILTWFVFESNKLDLAKYTFKNTVDRNNYYKLYNIFIFKSNIIKLDNYIKNYK